MVGIGYRQGRPMSDLDFFEMLNPVDKVQNIGCERFDCSVAVLSFSDKDTYFKYRVCFLPEFRKFVIIYYSHKMWNLWKMSDNLYDVLLCVYLL